MPRATERIDLYQFSQDGNTKNLMTDIRKFEEFAFSEIRGEVSIECSICLLGLAKESLVI